MFIGRWLGPAIHVGTAMTYKILKPDGGYVCCSTLRSWTSNEEANPVRMTERVSFMKQLNSCIDHAAKLSDFTLNDLTSEFEYDTDRVEDGFEGTPDDIKEAPSPTPVASEKYVGSRLQLPRGQSLAQGRVMKRAHDNDDNVIGCAKEKPILDTRGYIVEFEDGDQEEIAANTIDQSMYAQCDPDRNQYVMFDSIVDFRRSTTALCYADQKVLKADGRSFMRRTTAGWNICIQWKDGSTSWEKLSDLKESHPVECAEYALSQDLMNEHAFNWWVGFVLKKREHIISLVRKRNTCYLKRNEIFGIALPKNVKEALQLDKENGKTSNLLSRSSMMVKWHLRITNW